MDRLVKVPPPAIACLLIFGITPLLWGVSWSMVRSTEVNLQVANTKLSIGNNATKVRSLYLEIQEQIERLEKTSETCKLQQFGELNQIKEKLDRADEELTEQISELSELDDEKESN